MGYRRLITKTPDVRISQGSAYRSWRTFDRTINHLPLFFLPMPCINQTDPYVKKTNPHNVRVQIPPIIHGHFSITLITLLTLSAWGWWISLGTEGASCARQLNPPQFELSINTLISRTIVVGCENCVRPEIINVSVSAWVIGIIIWATFVNHYLRRSGCNYVWASVCLEKTLMY